MKSRITLSLFILASLLGCTALVVAAQESSEAPRKVVTRIVPQYPGLARSLNLKGTVRMVVLVAPNGSPKSMEARGGNPLLVQSAEKALRDWKWEPAAHETSEEIDLRFDSK